jgi:SAM-dependent methyltransferase
VRAALEPPWPRPPRAACHFYHAMDLPGLGAVAGQWDIRPDFDNYTGGLDWAGKSVLDVGTCSGFAAFELERRGARVTAFDADSVARFAWVPFAGTLYHRDRAAWNAASEAGLLAYKNAFWFAWHALGSKVGVVYGDIGRLSELLPPQDVVLACAVLEHLADPVSAIGHCARLAREAVVIGFTPVEMAEEPRLTPLQPWSRDHPYVWWRLSLGLYRALFAQLGFEIELRPAFAMFGGVRADRHTIVARRVSPP